MGNNTFIAKTGQFHKVKFNDGLVDFIFPGADRWPRSRPSADLEGTLGRPCPGLLAGMLLPAGGPSLLQLQGFRSSCSRPFSEAFLRGGQITASFPSPLISVRLGAGSLNSAVP